MRFSGSNISLDFIVMIGSKIKKNTDTNEKILNVARKNFNLPEITGIVYRYTKSVYTIIKIIAVAANKIFRLSEREIFPLNIF